MTHFLANKDTNGEYKRIIHQAKYRVSTGKKLNNTNNVENLKCVQKPLTGTVALHNALLYNMLPVCLIGKPGQHQENNIHI